MNERIVTTTIGIADDVKSNGKSAAVAGVAGIAGGTAVVAAYEAVPEMSAKVLVYGAPLLAAYMTMRSIFRWHKNRKPSPDQSALAELQAQYEKLQETFIATAKEKING